MKTSMRTFFVAVLAAAVPFAFGGLADSLTPLMTEVTPFSSGLVIFSSVYEFGGSYLYAYQLDNSQGTKPIVGFSIDVDSGVDILCMKDGTPPTYWEKNGSPAITVDAFFYPAPLNVGQVSAKMYYISSVFNREVYHNSAGVIGGGYAESNQVIAPRTPEPVTVLLLGTGALMALRRRYV